jgi:hypothetical protein
MARRQSRAPSRDPRLIDAPAREVAVLTAIGGGRLGERPAVGAGKFAETAEAELRRVFEQKGERSPLLRTGFVGPAVRSTLCCPAHHIGFGRGCGPTLQAQPALAAERQSPYANARFPDGNDGAVLQHRSGLCQRYLKPPSDVGRGVTAQAKHYDAYATRGPSQDLTEIKIGRQQDTPPPRRFPEDPTIAGAVETDLEDMYRIMPVASQPFSNARR